MPPDRVWVSQIGDTATLNDAVASINQWVASVRLAAAGGITVAELGSLLVQTLQLAIRVANLIPNDSDQRRELAVEAVAKIFDAVADRCVPMLLLPVWWIVRPAVRAAILASVAGIGTDGARSGALEVLLRSGPGPKFPPLVEATS